MKALKSDLAKQVLADPEAKDKLRRYLVSGSSATPTETVIEVRSLTGGRVRLKPVVVPKAA